MNLIFHEGGFITVTENTAPVTEDAAPVTEDAAPLAEDAVPLLTNGLYSVLSNKCGKFSINNGGIITIIMKNGEWHSNRSPFFALPTGIPISCFHTSTRSYATVSSYPPYSFLSLGLRQYPLFPFP